MTSEDVFLGGGSNSDSYNKQSLPNIKGEGKFAGYAVPQQHGVDCISGFASGGVNGCFSNSKGFTGNSYGDTRKIVFDASLSNSTYQDGANVRPNYFNVEWYIKYK